MYTVTSVMYRLTDPEEIFENVCETLRKRIRILQKKNSSTLML